MPEALLPGRLLHEHFAARPPGDARPRRRRRWGWWWAAGAAALVIAIVVVDMPVHASAAYRRSTLQSYLRSVDSDVARCRAGLHDAVEAYVGSVLGTPKVPAGVPDEFARQGIAVCGFTDSGVVNLGTTQPPRSITSPAVQAIAHQVDAWAYLDAFTVLQDLRHVIARPGSAAARQALSTEVAALHRRRQQIEQLVARADHAVGAPVASLPLTPVVSLLPGGRLPNPGGGHR